MSDQHLTIGSHQPPKVDNLLRLYSMKFCPFAHRVRLVLLAKEIPHDIVNINLVNKPEWYFKIHPEGKVPALDTGSEVIVESLTIADYLDEKYPQNPLYPKNADLREKDKQLIEKISDPAGVFFRCLFSEEQKSPEEWLHEFLEKLDLFEKELSVRGTTFYGGDNPGMVDFMFWPWAERAGAVAIKLEKPLPIEDSHIPLLRKWRKAMRANPVVDKIYNPPEKFWKIAVCKLKGTIPEYDSV